MGKLRDEERGEWSEEEGDEGDGERRGKKREEEEEEEKRQGTASKIWYMILHFIHE